MGARTALRGATAVIALGVALVFLAACGGSSDPAVREVAAATSAPPVATASPTPAPTPTPRTYPAPAHIVIPAIGVDAAVVTLGLDADAVPQVPDNRFDVAWYDFSARPGQGSNIVFAGHLQLHQIRGVFWDLDQLQPGDDIQLATSSGQAFAYKVTTVGAFDASDPNTVKLMLSTDQEMLTLITCGGTWVPNPQETFGGSYRDRTIVRAVPAPAG